MYQKIWRKASWTSAKALAESLLSTGDAVSPRMDRQHTPPCTRQDGGACRDVGTAGLPRRCLDAQL